MSSRIENRGEAREIDLPPPFHSAPHRLYFYRYVEMHSFIAWLILGMFSFGFNGWTKQGFPVEPAAH